MTTTITNGVQVLSANTVTGADGRGEVSADVAGAVTNPTITNVQLVAWDLQRGPLDGRAADAIAPLQIVAGAFYGSYQLGATGSVLTGPKQYQYQLLADSGAIAAQGQIRTTPLSDSDGGGIASLIVSSVGVLTALLQLAQLPLWLRLEARPAAAAGSTRRAQQPQAEGGQHPNPRARTAKKE